MKIDEKYFPQVYLEECKYKIKKIQTPRFISTELKSDSDLDHDCDDDSGDDSDDDSDDDSNK